MLNYQPSLDPVFHALADGTRRAIVSQLCNGPASVSDLARPLPISLPGVLQHLKVLEDSGLVVSAKQGRSRICRLNPTPLGEAEAWIADRRAFWRGALDRLAAFLDESGGAARGPPGKDQ